MAAPARTYTQDVTQSDVVQDGSQFYIPILHQLGRAWPHVVVYQAEAANDSGSMLFVPGNGENAINFVRSISLDEVHIHVGDPSAVSAAGWHVRVTG